MTRYPESRARRLFVAAACVSACLTPATARATYSIVASDTVTRQVGGAGTSCLGGSDVYIIYGSVPGVGAVHAQALFSAAGRDRAVELLNDGQAPERVIEAISATSFDARAASRQYAVVDVSGRSAAFTGAAAQSFAGDVQGQLLGYTYSVQGNILTSDAVLSRAAGAFEARGCDLAERLMLALEAGGSDGEGDSRCTTTRGIPSDSAFLQVDLPGQPRGGHLSLRVPSSGADHPLLELRSLFETWREQNPCSRPSVDENTATRDAGRDASAGRGAAVAAERAPELGGLGLPEEPGEQGVDAAALTPGDAGASPAPATMALAPARRPGARGSCHLASGSAPGDPSPPSHAALLAGALMLVARRPRVFTR